MDSAAPPPPAHPDLSSGESVLWLFERQAAKSPDHPAVTCAGKAVTYGELDARANAWAAALSAAGVGRDRFVGVYLTRSLEMVVALLAVLKSGAAYVYLDPEYPAERLAFILSDAKPVTVVTAGALKGRLPAPFAERALCVDEPPAAADPLATPASVSAEDLAYLVYTSGSTGTPKAVAMPHGVLRHLLQWQLAHWSPPAAARTLQYTSLNFDVSFQEIFSTLSSGGTLLILSEEQRRDPHELLQVIRDQAVERIFLPFVALQQLAAAFASDRIVPKHLRDVITAGEQLQITPQIRSFFEHCPGCTLHNQYGPAESHIVVTAFVLQGSPESWPLLPPIGKPLAQARIHLLDEQLQPVPAGETGEIFIGGDALARGYWNREELTAERFLPDPFSALPGDRLYRTGDLGSLLPSGDIQFLGRRDHQVKIRGVRVELGEIEAVLTQHPGVAQAVVRVLGTGATEKSLAAYVIPRGGTAPDAGELRRFLSERLPAQLVPSAFVAMPTFPLTSSGKVDRRALPEPDSQRTAAIIPPVTAREQQLVAIFEEVLRLQPIGLTDNFFELGGHSLLAVKVAEKIGERCGKAIAVAEVYHFPTVQELVKVVEGEISRKASTLLTFNAGGEAQPFFCIASYLDLPRRLGPEHPVFIVDPEQMDNFGCYPASIEGLASRYLADLRRVQPHGPYYLGGHCCGDLVAFEIAQRLLKEGEEVPLLVLFDPDSPYPLKTSSALSYKWWWRFLFHARRLLQLDRGTVKAYLADRFRNSWERIRLSLGSLYDQKARDFLKARAEFLSYVPQPYPGRVTLIVAANTMFRLKPAADPRLTWFELAAGGGTIHDVPGDHDTFLQEPNVDQAVQILRAALKQERTPAPAAAAGA